MRTKWRLVSDRTWLVFPRLLWEKRRFWNFNEIRGKWLSIFAFGAEYIFSPKGRSLKWKRKIVLDTYTRPRGRCFSSGMHKDVQNMHFLRRQQRRNFLVTTIYLVASWHPYNTFRSCKKSLCANYRPVCILMCWRKLEYRKSQLSFVFLTCCIFLMLFVLCAFGSWNKSKKKYKRKKSFARKATRQRCLKMQTLWTLALTRWWHRRLLAL